MLDLLFGGRAFFLGPACMLAGRMSLETDEEVDPWRRRVAGWYLRCATDVFHAKGLWKGC